ncbi:MAG: TetR/AcrR family transcriptional regulator [Umezawaea sp.]
MSTPDPAPSGARTAPPARAPRADALRNREKLLVTARDAFTAATDAGVSLESIARDAGVGIGTLYRHFPTREALVEAVYATEIDDVADSAPLLLAALPPEAALRAWMKRYAAFVATKRGMISTLRTGWESGSMATPVTRERVIGAIALILAEGARTGTLRADVAPADVATMLLGVFLATTAGGEPERTGTLLELVVDAVRVPADRP